MKCNNLKFSSLSLAVFKGSSIGADILSQPFDLHLAVPLVFASVGHLLPSANQFATFSAFGG